jgi:hypothetical protein
VIGNLLPSELAELIRQWNFLRAADHQESAVPVFKCDVTMEPVVDSQKVLVGVMTVDAATLADVTGLVIYFTTTHKILHGTLLQAGNYLLWRIETGLISAILGRVTSEERDIVHFLRSAPRAYFTVREIAKRAGGKKTFAETPDWPKPHLPGLVQRGVLEMDEGGRFRIKNQVEDIEANGRKWVSPHIAKLLKKGNKDFSDAATIEISEEEGLWD